MLARTAVRRGRRCGALLLTAVLGACRASSDTPRPSGVNPNPIQLRRPAERPLSPPAAVGEAMFFDPALSASGKISCASCHAPSAAYAPANDRAVQLGGLAGTAEGARAVPSLRYLDRIPAFGIGPDLGDLDSAAAAHQVARAFLAARAPKTADATPPVPAMVPRGGLFWDGRVNTLQTQAVAPLVDPHEMANDGAARLAVRLSTTKYAAMLARVFGARTVAPPARLLDEALFAIARFELEDRSFHPYSSKYDEYLEGKATLSAAEARGLAVFDDPRKGNCAACHLDRPGLGGRPPTFTDDQYEALGVPRNESIAANRDPSHYDLGLCGPIRTDLAADRRYCGMFRTPTLRNVATRHAFFHNGVYHTLAEVLRFYDLRDVAPDSIYPILADGHADRFNDLPPALRRNVDTMDAPFGRRRGAAPSMTTQDMRDVIAFLQTLTDEGSTTTASIP